MTPALPLSRRPIVDPGASSSVLEPSCARPVTTIRLPRALVSPNHWQGRHWRVKHRITQEWALELLAAGRPPAAPPGRMRVAITREVPTRRHLIRDDDNLRFCVKPLLDALTRQGYIRDDARAWIDLPTPTQVLAADGRAWTVIALSPADAAP